MTMTEEQAKTKWCPYARYAIGRDQASNRWKQDAPADQPHAMNPIPCRCIASECMAWRWKDKPGGHAGYDDARGRAEYAAKQKGYCGLAGAP